MEPQVLYDHVSLRRTAVATDCEPVGLLLNREEFDDVPRCLIGS